MRRIYHAARLVLPCLQVLGAARAEAPLDDAGARKRVTDALAKVSACQIDVETFQNCGDDRSGQEERVRFGRTGS